ncbi:response regulator [Methanoregula sp.]|uniref:response regulator n=1 Tax=Methanoregula sp. TaxID=2052170 RepID=UPI002C32CF5E|nr:response regulator [Methanoregula sp.]HVP96928.1 response regulator [Methanoregula sp.]
MSKGTILVVEDEFVTGSEIRARLEEMGFDVPAVVDTGEDAVQKAGELNPDIVVMDITLKGKMTGIEAADRIRAQYGTPVVYLTAHSDEATVNSAMLSEPFGYLIKPLDERALRTTIRMALYKHVMDEKVRQSEETIHGLLDATKDEVVLVDSADGKILACNEAFARSAGRPAADLTGVVVYTLIKTGGISMKTADAMQKKDAASPVSFEEEVQGRWFDTTLYVMRDSRTSRSQVAVFRHEITALKRAEGDLAAANRELVQEKERLALYASALDRMSDCVVITDATGNILYVNDTFEKKFALGRDDVKGKHFSELAHAENRYPLSKEEFLHYRDTGNIAVFVAKNAYGVKMTMTLTSSPILIVNKRPQNFVFVFRDKTG